MKSMLDRTMEIKITEEVGKKWKQNYEERLTFLYELFDHRPFRLHSEEKGRDRISAAIYDASMVALDRCWKQRSRILVDKERIQARMKELTGDPGVLPILTGQQNTANGIRERIELMRRILVSR